MMRFRHYNALITFSLVAKLSSMSKAADQLSLTKGAISLQVKRLEEALGFPLFDRQQSRLRLTVKGERLLRAIAPALDTVDKEIAALQDEGRRVVTLGLSTYLASRWLSPFLMRFMQQHPDICLRIQPMIDFDQLAESGADIAIRWGTQSQSGLSSELLFECPTFPVCDAGFVQTVSDVGLDQAMTGATLLHDDAKSTAWREWFELAGIVFPEKQEALTIPDPNVRVQAVIDGQGIALNDRLIKKELDSGELFRVGKYELSEYGYYVIVPPDRMADAGVSLLQDWLGTLPGEPA